MNLPAISRRRLLRHATLASASGALVGLTVSACDFMDRGKVQVALESEVEAALVFGNRFRGKERILNQAGERAQIGMNVVSG